MSVAFREKFKSRHTVEGANPSVEIIHFADVSGETDENLAVVTAAIATLPDTYDSKPRQSIEAEELAPDLWQVTTTYAYTFSSFTLPTGGSASSFDTTGGTRHLTQSLATRGRYAPVGGVAPDFGGAIGVNDDTVDGVDILDRRYRFREIRIVADSAVDAAYKAVIYGLSGSVNTDIFQGFQPGEVLFEGATGTQRSESDWEIVFHFSALPNATDLSVGDITVAEKKGWEYLWVRYVESVDEAARALVKSPVAAYVEQVYPEGEFAALGL